MWIPSNPSGRPVVVGLETKRRTNGKLPRCPRQRARDAPRPCPTRRPFRSESGSWNAAESRVPPGPFQPSCAWMKAAKGRSCAPLRLAFGVPEGPRASENTSARGVDRPGLHAGCAGRVLTRSRAGDSPCSREVAGRDRSMAEDAAWARTTRVSPHVAGAVRSRGRSRLRNPVGVRKFASRLESLLVSRYDRERTADLQRIGAGECDQD